MVSLLVHLSSMPRRLCLFIPRFLSNPRPPGPPSSSHFPITQPPLLLHSQHYTLLCCSWAQRFLSILTHFSGENILCPFFSLRTPLVEEKFTEEGQKAMPAFSVMKFEGGGKYYKLLHTHTLQQFCSIISIKYTQTRYRI